jgi:hypothetical protein
MIRKAKFEDLKRCVELWSNFVYEVETALDEPHIDRSDKIKPILFYAMSTPNQCLLVDDQVNSFLLGHVSKHPIWGQPIAVEYAWWIEPSSRSLTLARAYISEFNSWAKTHNAHSVVMSSAPAMKSSSVLYKREGFTPFESTYIRKL